MRWFVLLGVCVCVCVCVCVWVCVARGGLRFTLTKYEQHGDGQIWWKCRQTSWAGCCRSCYGLRQTTMALHGGVLSLTFFLTLSLSLSLSLSMNASNLEVCVPWSSSSPNGKWSGLDRFGCINPARDRYALSHETVATSRSRRFGGAQVECADRRLQSGYRYRAPLSRDSVTRLERDGQKAPANRGIRRLGCLETGSGRDLTPARRLSANTFFRPHSATKTDSLAERGRLADGIARFLAPLPYAALHGTIKRIRFSPSQRKNENRTCERVEKWTKRGKRKKSGSDRSRNTRRARLAMNNK